MKKVISSGKRKRAVARAVLIDGSGKITLNKKGYDSFSLFDRLKLQEPMKIAEHVLGKINFDAQITTRGGGSKGQIEAARLALAKGIIDFSGSEKLKDAYVDYDRNMIVADVRRKEAYKPGDSKARSKRQKSFR
ncbi:30S ribosomal protein S9 [uncultured archaeon]|nr:30S ribosomal protein S9 [uncultured archaeon]